MSLANAWSSGAWAWDNPTRRAYANGLTRPEHLVAVSQRIDSAKGDRSTDQWMIPSLDQDVRCAYLTNWAAVKARWGLTVTPAEADTLSRGINSQC